MSNNYSYIFCPDNVTLTNLDTGNTTTVYSTDTKFSGFKSLIASKKFEEAETMADCKQALQKFSAWADDTSFHIEIEDGQAFYTWNAGDPKELHNAIIDRILRMVDDNVSPQPLVNFMGNLLMNPSKQSVDEAYLFLEACKAPITEDGCFIAYKIVKNDYMDIYSGKYDNSVGSVVEMERNEVDDNRENTCSNGLHFCSREYLSHYASSNRETDRCVLVKINPADIVSIPKDYNNAKGRTWRYEVVGEVNDSSWRSNLSVNDYTDSVVVDSNGDDYEDDFTVAIDGDGLNDNDYLDDDGLDAGLTWEDVNDAGFGYDTSKEVWWDNKKNRRCSINHVANKSGFDISELESLL